MADVELVIKIPKSVYNYIKQLGSIPTRDTQYIANAIFDGTPLPKGHGRLIDVNDLLDKIGLEDNDDNRENNVGEIITLEDFDFIPIIIEAESKEGGL